MVRQPQSKANAGAFNNGMPMTSSLGLRHVGRQHRLRERAPQALHEHDLGVRPIKIDQPSDEELFGEFYEAALEQEPSRAKRW
jgi:sulfoacetaldehyde dehydrogenase